MKHPKSGICYIAGAGNSDIVNIKPERDDILIAADGGFDLFQKSGLQPDLLIGDFDSINSIPGASEKAIRFPEEKDDTDMMLAIKFGHRKGYRKFILFGGLGGRMDHSLANIQSLVWLARHRSLGFLYNRGTAITAIHNGELIFPQQGSGILSVFAHDRTVRGVTLSGLKYPLNQATLHNNAPLGVSNAFIGEKALISVRQGTLVILWMNGEFSLSALPQAKFNHQGSGKVHIDQTAQI